ncbi:MAG TPA: DegV family protein [Patescibacteria group bacterium]|nr:DegV family protein [Patescibacteria group bacterium]
MKNIGILVGEDCDLPEKIIKDSGINIFPFVLEWEELKKQSEIYKTMRGPHKTSPKTSQPSPATFKELFEKCLEKYQDLIVLTVSSKFSGTYNSSVQARKMLDKKLQDRVHIVDSEVSSGAEALLVFEAISMIDTDEKVEKIVEKLRRLSLRVNLLGAFEDPQWLVAGGRLNPIKALLVKNLLKGGFRPILTIKDGQIVVKKIQGNAHDSAEALFNQFKNDFDNRSPDSEVNVVITHADFEDQANLLSKKLANFSHSVKIKFIHEISPVIGSHLGPGALLLSWIVK